MANSHQLYHVIFLISSYLAVVSGAQYLKYKTGIACRGAAMLFDLAIIMVCYSISWFFLPASEAYFFFTFQVIGFYLLPILFLFFTYSIVREVDLKKTIILFMIACLPIIMLAALLFFAFGTVLSQTMPDYLPGFVFKLTPIIGRWQTFFTFYFFVVCSISIFVSALIIILDKKPFARLLSLPMLLGALFIVGISILEIIDIQPFWPVSILQIGLALICLVFFMYAIVFKFGGLLPVSREIVFDVIRDGIILLDLNSKIVDINNPAVDALKLDKKTILHKHISVIWPEIADEIAKQPFEKTITREIEVSSPYYDVSTQIIISRLVGLNDTTTGRLVFIRNITDLDRVEKALVERSKVLIQTNQIMHGLAEMNLHIQATNNLSDIFEGLNGFLKKMDLDCFITLLDAASGDLRMSNISLHPQTVNLIEKITRYEFRVGNLKREHFHELYTYLDSDDTTHFATTFLGREPLMTLGIFGGLRPAFQKIGIDPAEALMIYHLMAGSKKIGLMGVWGKGFSQEIINPLTILAGQVAWAIERVELYHQESQRSQELQRSNQLITTLANISVQLGKSHDFSHSLQTLGKELENIGLHCVLGAVDEASENVTLQFASFEKKIKGLGEKIPGFNLVGYQLPKKLWPSNRVINNGVPVWYSNINAIFSKMFPMVPEKIFESGLHKAGITKDDRLCILPLIEDSKVTGVLPVWGKDIEEKDTPALLIFANQISELLQKIKAYEDETNRANNLARSNRIIIALSNVAASLETTANLSEIFSTLGKELLKVNIYCMVGTLDKEKKYLKIEYLSILPEIQSWGKKWGFEWPDEIRIPRNLWPTDKAVVEHVPYWDPKPIGSVSKMIPFVSESSLLKTYEMVGMSTTDQACYLPMISEDDVIGILAVLGPDLQIDDIPGLSVFANQVATAIHNSNLYNQAQEEIRNRAQTEIQIQGALAEKEILLKEIHHRVKNNLQIISSLLNLQMSQFANEESIEGLRESQNRVRAMALIHEKLYQSDDLARINFSSYLQSLINSLAQTYRFAQDRIAIAVETDNILLDMDTAIPCGLIVNELVSNSLKHAFPGEKSGMISIVCRKISNNAYSLMVSDNGVGFPDQLNPAKVTTLGLKLVSSLVKQVGGQIKVDGRNGARFEIEFSSAGE